MPPRAIAPTPARASLAALLLIAGCRCASPGGPSEPPKPQASAGPRATSGPPAAGGARFLKGQLHLHSDRSGDSDTPPEEVTAWYAARGYDFIVFTDHNRVTDTPDPPGMLTLPGVEITQNLRDCDPPPLPGLHCLLHVDALLVRRDVPLALPRPEAAPRRIDRYARALDAARELDGIAQLNHPNFHYAADLEVLLALAGRGLVLLEVANMALDSANEGDATHPSTEALWDAALARGARVFATATDDAHHYGDAAAVRARGETAYVGDLGFVMGRAEPREPSIREALQRGDFYATTGILLDRLELTTDRLAVEVQRGAGAAPRIELVGPGGAVLRDDAAWTLEVDPRPLVPAGAVRYVRVRVTDAGGRRAWTQPVWLDAR